jgi:hypothetical protein
MNLHEIKHIENDFTIVLEFENDGKYETKTLDCSKLIQTDKYKKFMLSKDIGNNRFSKFTLEVTNSKTSLSFEDFATIINDIVGFTFVRNTTRAGTIRGHATTYSISATRATNCTWIEPSNIQGSIYLATCNGITITDTKYADVVSGATLTTYANYVWNLTANTLNVTISGLTFPTTNVHPYTALLIGSAGCANVKLRNIGTYASPLTMGSANACGLIYTLGTNCQDFKFQRIYTINTRTNIMTAENSCKNILEEIVNGDYGDAPLSAVLNLNRRNCKCTASATAQTSIYGTHWSDFHTSTTAGRIMVIDRKSVV